MKADSRVHAVMKANKARYAAGSLKAEEMVALASRARRIQAREAYLRRRRGEGASIDADSLGRLDRLAEVLATGGSVAAIDTGMARQGLGVDEVGISTWRDGHVDTVTLFDETALHRHPDPSFRVPLTALQVYRPALYGPSVAVPSADLARLAQEAADAADVVVFHAMHADMHRLGIAVAVDRVLDTERCGKLWTPGTPSLSDLCVRLGVPAEGAHNSGNDARHTLSVALALATTERREILRAYVHLGEERRATFHRLMMHPSRAGGYDAVLLDRNRASSAHSAYANAVARTGEPPPPRRRKAAG